MYLSCVLLSTKLSCDGEQGLMGRTIDLFLFRLDPPLLLPRNVTFGGSANPFHVRL